ncbi:MAG: hypothetical protein KGN36_02530 [Acidobacteriota bacterium]|nr:hypothetical protein [Acidobacteriota bacterium]
MQLDFSRDVLPIAVLALAAGLAAALTLSRTVDPKFRLLDSLLRDADPETEPRHVDAA